MRLLSRRRLTSAMTLLFIYYSGIGNSMINWLAIDGPAPFSRVVPPGSLFFTKCDYPAAGLVVFHGLLKFDRQVSNWFGDKSSTTIP
jgi:hypothetical protein